MGWVSGQEADFSYVDLLDEDGANILERADLMDPLPLCQDIRSAMFEGSPLVKRLAKRFDTGRLLLYLEKAVEEQVPRTVMRISTVSWFRRTGGTSAGPDSVFYIEQTPWQGQLKDYALTHKVDLRGYRAIHWPTSIPVKRFSFLALTPLRQLLSSRTLRRTRRLANESTVQSSEPREQQPSFRVAVRYNGNGVTLDPGKNSDLFWVPFARLLPEQLLVYAGRGDDALDETKYAGLRRSYIQATGLRNGAKVGTIVPSWPSFHHFKKLPEHIRRDWKWLVPGLVVSFLGKGSSRWIAGRLVKFVITYMFWRWFFTSFNVRMDVDYWVWDKSRLASEQALADLGGLSVSYQRSYHPYPSLHRVSAADVHFAFSTAWAEPERQSRSAITQLVANGYVHDHAFAGVRGLASRLRDRLCSQGARFIICFLDENSKGDQREGPSHTHQAANYRYLLERLLADPSLGVIFKPKKPATLRQRLGPMSELLDSALDTGRCYLHESGIIATTMLPCEASLAADVTVGIVYGATAAFESALAGTPTVLLDRESMTYHPLYGLGQGQVVFREWDSLWEALSRYRDDPSSTPGFGDWSSMLSTLDEFRDGKAAHRMGEYITWLVDGLTEGLSREKALERARRKYTELWGSNKVVDIRAEAFAGTERTGRPKIIGDSKCQ